LWQSDGGRPFRPFSSRRRPADPSKRVDQRGARNLERPNYGRLAGGGFESGNYLIYFLSIKGRRTATLSTVVFRRRQASNDAFLSPVRTVRRRGGAFDANEHRGLERAVKSESFLGNSIFLRRRSFLSPKTMWITSSATSTV
jgi:hypothetical protein